MGAPAVGPIGQGRLRGSLGKILPTHADEARDRGLCYSVENALKFRAEVAAGRGPPGRPTPQGGLVSSNGTFTWWAEDIFARVYKSLKGVTDLPQLNVLYPQLAKVDPAAPDDAPPCPDAKAWIVGKMQGLLQTRWQADHDHKRARTFEGGWWCACDSGQAQGGPRVRWTGACLEGASRPVGALQQHLLPTHTACAPAIVSIEHSP